MLTGLCEERDWFVADGGRVVLCWSPPQEAPLQFLTRDASIWTSGASDAIFNLRANSLCSWSCSSRTEADVC